MKLRKLAALAVGGATLLLHVVGHGPGPRRGEGRLQRRWPDRLRHVRLRPRRSWRVHTPERRLSRRDVHLQLRLRGVGSRLHDGFEGGYAVRRGAGRRASVRRRRRRARTVPRLLLRQPYNAQLCANYGGVYCVNEGYAGGTTTSFAFWVGGTAIYSFKGGPWFVAADIRVEEAPALYTSQFGVSFMPGGGAQF